MWRGRSNEGRLGACLVARAAPPASSARRWTARCLSAPRPVARPERAMWSSAGMRRCERAAERPRETPATPLHRPRPVVPALRAAFGSVRPSTGPAPRRPAARARHRSAGPGPSRGPPGEGPRGCLAGLPDPAGLPGVERRGGGPPAHRVLGVRPQYDARVGRPSREQLASLRARQRAVMTRAGALPPLLRREVSRPGGFCYRHCERPLRTLRLASRLPGTWTVRACPSGVVSVTSYAEWTRRDPGPEVRRLLRTWTQPKTLVRSWDLRVATRHGPELGRPAERLLLRNVPRRPVRVVYWRLYPFRARDGSPRRLFLCLRGGRSTPVFFAADPSSSTARCPACAARDRSRRTSRRRRHSSRRR